MTKQKFKFGSWATVHSTKDPKLDGSIVKILGIFAQTHYIIQLEQEDPERGSAIVLTESCLDPL